MTNTLAALIFKPFIFTLLMKQIQFHLLAFPYILVYMIVSINNFNAKKQKVWVF